ncbi:MAG: hypothetical protein RLZZ330_584 [Actinomycetota bacterium]|jgi:maltose 6'-phosphate phosphatase
MLRLLSLNLHCYQEVNQLEKFQLIAKAIYENSIDVIFFQEAAQHKDSSVIEIRNGIEIKADNAIKLIRDELSLLGSKYEFLWDWSHYGWDVWEEGVGILSKLPLVFQSANYITKSSSQEFWLSRKVLEVQIDINGLPINLVSVHTGFWNDNEESYENQIENLLELNRQDTPVLFAGDFNVEAGTPGYEYIMQRSNFRDLDLEVNQDGMFNPTIGGVIDGWPEVDGKSKRIDYLFTTSNNVICKKVNRIFTEENYGEVSDHYGLLAEVDLLNFH